MQDVDAVDLVEFSDAMAELEHGDVVHGDPEGLGGTEDLHLQRQSARQRDLCDHRTPHGHVNSSDRVGELQ